MSGPKYIVGIDLGTTNSVVAYTEANIEKGRKPEIRIFEPPQVIAPGAVETRSMLPSFIFIPGKYDAGSGDLALPWDRGATSAVGEFARERGAELPQHLVSSAKSWLCHPLVDRNKPILPWNGPDEAVKISPVEASAAILRHIRDAWNHAMAGEDASLCLEQQEIFLTVPASFDAVARDLTVKAARKAGLETIILLEEPQAAFYAWIESSADAWRENVEPGDLVMVCDIGGGTSDFSLIRVSEENGNLALERIAVGDHLLVGGDNMDLALAYALSNRLSAKGTRLDAWQMRGLWHNCRGAKEKMFADPGKGPHVLSILGRGSRLIGGTIRTELDYATVEKTILDGFLPVCRRDDPPVAPQRTGLQELGLTYESDPAVTRHMAHFLLQHATAAGKYELPSAVLFNGGVMKPTVLRQRILDVLGGWSESGARQPVRELASRDLDLSVARGAAYYGLARKGQGIRIRSGLSKTYYIGIAASMPAVPGMPPPVKALCVAPFGMEEGTDSILKDREFVLVVGRPVKFDLMGSAVRLDDAVGAIVETWDPGEIEDITTIETQLDGQEGLPVPVTIEIRLTEVGAIEFWCVSKVDGRRWKLEFNVREKASIGNGIQ